MRIALAVLCFYVISSVAYAAHLLCAGNKVTTKTYLRNAALALALNFSFPFLQLLNVAQKSWRKFRYLTFTGVYLGFWLNPAARLRNLDKQGLKNFNDDIASLQKAFPAYSNFYERFQNLVNNYYKGKPRRVQKPA